MNISLPGVIKNNKLHLFRKILSSNPQKKLVDEHGNTALMLAAFFNRSDFIQDLIDINHASIRIINQKNKKGRTALYFAARQGNIECIELLISLGACPNIADYGHVSPLQIAIKNNQNSKTLHTLIDNGARLDYKDGNGRDALWYAKKMPSKAHVKLLAKRAGTKDINILNKAVAFFNKINTELTHHALYLLSTVFPAFNYFQLDKISASASPAPSPKIESLKTPLVAKNIHQTLAADLNLRTKQVISELYAVNNKAKQDVSLRPQSPCLITPIFEFQLKTKKAQANNTSQMSKIPLRFPS